MTDERRVDYTAFGAWYDRYRPEVLEPGLEHARVALDALLRDQLSERDLARVRNVSGRVKSKRRTWRKLRQPRYRDRVTSVDDIPSVIDDLLGLRITCINLRDLDMVQGALDSLPRRRGARQGLALDLSTERDYVLEPKPSGYRGWHVNLAISVDRDGQRTVTTTELQVRTLLQDSWGELTHEDTYSKDGALPPLVEILSKRMADLLATLDDIAEDLRTELDRIDDAVVGEFATDDAVSTGGRPGRPLVAVTAPVDESEQGSEQAADAATVLLERWRTLDRPTDLASLAWGLQRDFGAEISDDWFGRRTFKQFLLDAVPEAEIITDRHAYLLPPGTPRVPAADDREDEPDASRLPEQARAMRRIDRRFPLLEAEQWDQLFADLAAAWSAFGPTEPTARAINLVARAARDRAAERGTALSRRHLDYVAKAVMSSDDASVVSPIDARSMAERFAETTVRRMIDLRLIRSDDRDAIGTITTWLNRHRR